jgi:putative SOS response-associated peptidase YedK
VPEATEIGAVIATEKAENTSKVYYILRLQIRRKTQRSLTGPSTRELRPSIKRPRSGRAFRKRRCLIAADGFYEWRKTAKPKLPFAIARKDGRPFTFAGLWENWKDLESGEWLRTCAIYHRRAQ